MYSLCHQKAAGTGLYLFDSKINLPLSVFSSITPETLQKRDKEAYEKLMKKTNGSPPAVLYFNKGL